MNPIASFLISLSIGIMIGFLAGALCEHLTSRPMENWQRGYDDARKVYSNWNDGFDKGFRAGIRSVARVAEKGIDLWKNDTENKEI